LKTNVVTVRPSDRIRLAEIDPDDTGGLKKKKACAHFVDLRDQIDELQKKLYAEHRRSLLIIFQALDTGGKDGAIKSLCLGMIQKSDSIRSR